MVGPPGQQGSRGGKVDGNIKLLHKTINLCSTYFKLLNKIKGNPTHDCDLKIRDSISGGHYDY
jgi:hypothetical protein